MDPRLLLFSLCIFLVVELGHAAAADAMYPSRPVRFIVQGAAGSGPDVLARVVVDHLGKRWHRPIVVVNRPGAGGLMALQMAAAAEHDGYTFFVPSITTFVILPEMHETLPADPARDFVAIGLLAQTPMMIATSRALPVNTLAELVAVARRDAGSIFYAANNRGSLPHLAAELWRDRAGAPMTFVPYAGAAAALQDVLGGHVSVIVESVGALSGPINAERIRPLAVASAARLSTYPDLPTVAETTPGFTAVAWFVLSAPRGTPREMIGKVSNDLRGALSESVLVKRFEELGALPGTMNLEQTQQFIQAEQKRWRPLVRRVGLTAQ